MADVRTFPPPEKPTLVAKPFRFFEPYEHGRQRRMLFDINTLADFEQLTGMGFSQLMQQKAIFAVARAMVFAGLKRHDRSLTLERIGDLLFEWMKADRENHTIDVIITFCFDCALEQGALARAPEEEFGVTDALPPTKNLSAGDGDVIEATATPATTTPNEETSTSRPETVSPFPGSNG